MYYIPRPVKCPKCGYEDAYSPSIAVGVALIDNMPACPMCWEKFIKQHVPKMEYVYPQEKQNP